MNVAQTDLFISVRPGSSLGHRCLYTAENRGVCMFLSQPVTVPGTHAQDPRPRSKRSEFCKALRFTLHCNTSKS